MIILIAIELLNYQGTFKVKLQLWLALGNLSVMDKDKNLGI